ncbi:MAG TPA: MFS transporter [Polyangia bacterium]|nr:MFS transporter [Polyangia bacterium]
MSPSSHSQRQQTPTPIPAPAAPSQPGGPLGLPRTFWVLWSGMLLNRVGSSVFFLLALYLTGERGLSSEVAALVISCYAVGGLVAGPVAGVLADRVGRRFTLLIGTACAGTLMLALGSARATTTIVVLAPLLGFFTDLCRPPLQAAVADVVPAPQRTRAFGLIYWAVNLGFAGAASIGGALAQHSFGLLFVIDALTTFAYGTIILVAVPETRPAAPPTHLRAQGHRALLAPFADRRLMSFVGIQLLLLLAFTQVIVALPLDMHRHALDTWHIGWLLGLNGVIIVVAQPLALRFVRGFGQVHWLVAGAVVTGLGLGVNALAGGASVYAAATLLWTLGEIGFSTAAPTLIADLSPVDRRGAYQGTHQLAWGLATMIAPVGGSFVLDRFGGPAMWLGCLGLCFVAATLHLRVTARNVGPAR